MDIHLHLMPITMSTSTKNSKKDRYIDPLYGFDVERIKTIIEKTDLSEREKDLMCYRWLVRVENMEKDARKSKVRHYLFKMIIIAGSAIVPVLASMNNPPEVSTELTSQVFIYYTTLIMSMIVSISAGVHEFFRFGDRWRHYRGTVESLKSEGWHFIQQTGRYRTIGGHTKGYKRFAERVENILNQERERFMNDIAKEKVKDDPTSDTTTTKDVKKEET